MDRTIILYQEYLDFSSPGVCNQGDQGSVGHKGEFPEMMCAYVIACVCMHADIQQPR